MLAGARVGLAWRSLILSVGTYFATSLYDGDSPSDDPSQVGGFMGRLSGSLGWTVGKYIVVEGGMSAEYLRLKRGNFEADALVFPFQAGFTLRFPFGRNSAIGIRSVASFAIDPASEGFYFSVFATLVYQTL